MRSVFLLLPFLGFILTVSIAVLLIYALISLVKSNQSQADSLREIELILKRLYDEKND